LSHPTVSTFLERSVLAGVPTLLVLFFVTNPMKWEWPLQLGASFVVVGLGIIVGYTVEHMRKPKAPAPAVAPVAAAAPTKLPAATDMTTPTAQPAPVPTPAPTHPHPGATHMSNDEKHDKPAAEPPVHMEQHNSGNASGNFQMYKPTVNFGPQPRTINPANAEMVVRIVSTIQPKRASMHWANGKREATALANSVWQVLQDGGWTLADKGPWLAYPCEGADADIIVLAHTPPTEYELAVSNALMKLGLKIGVCQSQGDAPSDSIKLIAQGPS
jgi:hypothetical protein